MDQRIPSDALGEVADLLRRFSLPRAWAGDYHAHFAERILTKLLDLGWDPPEGSNWKRRFAAGPNACFVDGVEVTAEEYLAAIRVASRSGE